MTNRVLHSFPVRDHIRPFESGQGYVLRMVQENRLLGLHEIKAMLGKSRYAVIDGDDAPTLHRWFGADEARLRTALGRTQTGDGKGGYEYARGPIGRSYFINRMYPRICPQCVREQGHCELCWDLSLVVACDRHQKLLIDHCRHCSRQISWNRASLELCGCGDWLEAAENVPWPTEVELQFATWASACVAHQCGISDHGATRPLHPHPLITLLWPMSLDGGMRLVYALGTAAGYEKSMSQADIKPRAAMAKARYVLKLAGGLAQRIARLEPVKFEVRQPTVIIGLLAESLAAQAPDEDKSMVYSILRHVFYQSRSTRSKKVYPQLSQMALF